MAAIVTTALYVPVAGLAALLALALGLPLESLVTFGGRLTALEGLLAWWGILLVPAGVYSASVMPWHAGDASG